MPKTIRTKFTMTVGELKRDLEQFDDDMLIVVPHGDSSVTTAECIEEMSIVPDGELAGVFVEAKEYDDDANDVVYIGM
jgi:hypothetical protein